MLPWQARERTEAPLPALLALAHRADLKPTLMVYPIIIMNC